MPALTGFILTIALSVLLLPFHLWTALLAAAALFIGSLCVLHVLERSTSNRRLVHLMYFALFAKLVASLLQYATTVRLYGRLADAQDYHDRGMRIAASVSDGNIVAPIGAIPGTGFIELVTGLLYAATAPSILVGFLFFSWLGFWGLYFFLRAFRLSFPEGDLLRYGYLVLLLPSLLFWPSGIGKEAWMVLGLGLASYGTARMYSQRPGGVSVLLLGLLACACVRPHVALILVVSAIAGYVLRPGRQSRGGPLGKALALTGLLFVATLVISQVGSFFNVDSTDTESLGQVLDRTSAQTARGDSTFGTQSQFDTTGALPRLPWALITVLFRPFPFEASNVQALVTSVEGSVLLGLVAVTVVARTRRPSSAALRRPYAVFCTTYVLLFVLAFSSFSNFGILTRQRVQVFPLLLVLVALPLASSLSARSKPRRSSPTTARDDGPGTPTSLPRNASSRREIRERVRPSP